MKGLLKKVFIVIMVILIVIVILEVQTIFDTQPLEETIDSQTERIEESDYTFWENLGKRMANIVNQVYSFIFER